MDPNNNKPIETSPQQPTVPQPVVTPPVQPTPIAPAPVSQTPKKSNKKWLILLLILLLLAAGIIAYVLFASRQMKDTQKESTDNSSLVLPTPTLLPTLAPEEDLEVASPEGDLIDLEADVKAL